MKNAGLSSKCFSQAAGPCCVMSRDTAAANCRTSCSTPALRAAVNDAEPVGTSKPRPQPANANNVLPEATRAQRRTLIFHLAHKYSVRGRNGTQYGCNGGRTGVYCVQWSEQGGCRGTCPLTPSWQQHRCRGERHVRNRRCKASRTYLSGSIASGGTLRQRRSTVLRALQPVVLPHALPRSGVAWLRAGAGRIVK